MADEIAYLTADLDDGLGSGILTLAQVRDDVPLFRGFHDAVLAEYPAAKPKLTVTEAINRVLDALVTDLMQEVRARVTALGAATLEDIRQAPQRLATLSPSMEAARATVKTFLYATLYNSPGMEQVHHHAAMVVEELFAILIADPGMLPEDHLAQISAEGLARTIADYIAGMTDSYVEQLWARCGGS
jgi:dGTPase